MARRRRSYSRRRYERKIEHRQWFTSSEADKLATVTVKAGADTDNVIKLAVDPLKGDDQTILRTRGFFHFTQTAIAKPGVAVLGGIVLPNKMAADASAAELPNPLLDSDTTDWFVWQPTIIPADVAASGTVTEQDAVEAAVIEWSSEVDSKAKRIMEAAESVVWILGMNAAQAESNKAVSYSYVLRTLVGY
jgi:hypothetical protein